MDEKNLFQENQIPRSSGGNGQSLTTSIWDIKVVISFVISAMFIIIGFYKMLAYSYEEYADDNVNAYVGGDAYNYIINSNYAIAYFVLALLFTIIGCTLLICNIIQKKGY